MILRQKSVFLEYNKNVLIITMYSRNIDLRSTINRLHIRKKKFKQINYSRINYEIWGKKPPLSRS